MKTGESSTAAVMPHPSPDFADEAARLQVLESFEHDALEDDPELASIIRFAAHLCDVPVSQVTLVEEVRQYFLVREGIEDRETPRDQSFCAHSLGMAGMLEVPDTTADSRFAQNPLVTGWPEVRFYAGQPLISPEGASLGTICVVDLKPRMQGLSAFQRQGMAVLAQAVMRRLNARREQLVATRELARSAAQFITLANAIPDIAWSTAADGTVQYLNSRWYEFTGEDRRQSPPDSGVSRIHPDDQPRVLGMWGKALAAAEPFEAEIRLRHRDGSYRWVITRSFPAFDGSGRLTGWFGTSTDIDDFHRLSESRDLLSRELAHRIKNIFAVVIGLAMLKARAAPEHLGFAEDLTAALRSLASAHQFAGAGDAPLPGANLHALLAALFSPYRDKAGGPLVMVSGADCAIAANVATPLALVFHEMATNSAKYGALSAEGGRVTLSIAEDGEDYALSWRETGGPVVSDIGKRGFGTRLVDMAVGGQLQGRWTRNFAADGLAVDLVVPKAVIAA